MIIFNPKLHYVTDVLEAPTDASCAPVSCPLFWASFIGACPSSTCGGQSYLPTVRTSHLHYAPQLAPTISGRRQPHVGMRVGGEGSRNFHTPEESINSPTPQL